MNKVLLLLAMLTLTVVVTPIASAATSHGDDHPLTTEVSRAADSCPNAAIRAQQHSEHLPDCRAFEIVSPVQKNGYSTQFFPGFFGLNAVSTAGDAVVFSGFGVFPGAPSGAPATYRSARSSTGWSSKIVSPLPSRENADYYTSSPLWQYADPDLRAGFTDLGYGWDPAFPSAAGVVSMPVDSPTQLLSRGNGDEVADAARFSGVSENGAHVFFTSASHLVSEDADRVAGSDLYERYDGHTYLVNRDNNGSLANRCGSSPMDPDSSKQTQGISPDGDEVVFSTPAVGQFGDPDCDAPTRLYVRLNRSATREISRSRMQTPDAGGPQPARYVGSAESGARIFFTSNEQLTDDQVSGGGLYEYRVGDDSLRLRVTMPTSGFSPLLTAQNGSVIFTNGATEGQGDPSMGNNLFLLTDSGLRYIPTAEFPLNDLWFTNAAGSVFVVQSTAAVTGEPTGGVANTFVYSVQQDRLTCVSCDPAGQRPENSGRGIETGPNRNSLLPPAVTPDGSVFFEAGDQLVAQDTNGTRDVYEWSNGRLALITPGDSEDIAYLLGASKDGKGIFVATTRRLSPQDVDVAQDIYVAQVDGGFPYDNLSVTDPACVGDSCQGAPSASAPTPSVATLTFNGAGNLPEVRRGALAASVKVSRLKAVTGTSATLKVKVPTAGAITVSGSGVTTTKRSATRSATYSLHVVLTAKAERSLKRHKTLKVKARVGFKPKTGKEATASVTVTFKQPKAKASLQGGR